MSELVSGGQRFPASWDYTGNFVRLDGRAWLLARIQQAVQRFGTQFPTHRNRELIFGLAGN
jgi:hypothetical protein